jgi:SAM-dependent methyltransferase
MPSLLRRRRTAAPELAPPVPADEVLGRLIDRDQLIDRFDANYLDDLPEILREVHGISDENAAGNADVQELWKLSGREPGPLAELADALVQGAGVDPNRWAPRQNTPEDQKRFKYTKVSNWRKAAGVRLDRGSKSSADAVEVVNELQSGYSHNVQGGKHEVAFDALERPETGDPWSDFIRKLREDGVISADEQHLTIGPRWVGEIHYFRQGLGLPKTIGLDLFTHDDELVKVGDMHEMPFEDNTFGLVYQRNTFDKSYDIRSALRECLRVLRDGGVLISDDCYDYTHGVSEMARTNIRHNNQIARVLGPNVAEVLYDRETPSEEDWIARVGQVAIRVKK